MNIQESDILADQSKDLIFKWANNKEMNSSDKRSRNVVVFILLFSFIVSMLCFIGTNFLDFSHSYIYFVLLFTPMISCAVLSITGACFLFLILINSKAISSTETVKLVNKTKEYPETHSIIKMLYNKQGLVTISQRRELYSIIERESEKKASKDLSALTE